LAGVSNILVEESEQIEDDIVDMEQLVELETTIVGTLDDTLIGWV
jgi:hypothetical protein